MCVPGLWFMHAPTWERWDGHLSWEWWPKGSLGPGRPLCCVPLGNPARQQELIPTARLETLVQDQEREVNIPRQMRGESTFQPWGLHLQGLWVHEALPPFQEAPLPLSRAPAFNNEQRLLSHVDSICCMYCPHEKGSLYFSLFKKLIKLLLVTVIVEQHLKTVVTNSSATIP
jgi:hypothetical protein